MEQKHGVQDSRRLAALYNAISASNPSESTQKQWCSGIWGGVQRHSPLVGELRGEAKSLFVFGYRYPREQPFFISPQTS